MRRHMNLTMLMDFYELTMSKGYFEHGMQDQIAYFDMFYRKNPDNGGYVGSSACGDDIGEQRHCKA